MQSEFREREAQAACKTADAKLAKANRGADELVELRKRQASFDESM